MLILSKEQLRNTSNILSTSNVAGYPPSNLNIDKKSSSWRSTSKAYQTITVTWTSNINCNFVALCHNNFDSNTIVRIKYFTNPGDTSNVYDSQNIFVGNVFEPPIGFNTNSSNSFTFGGGNYFSNESPTHAIKKLTIDISNSTPDNFYEIARICTGEAVRTFDPESGVELSIIDDTEILRTESGDSIVDIRPVHKELSLNLGYVSATDRKTLINCFRQASSKYPVYVSLAANQNDSIDKSIQLFGHIDELSLSLNELYVSSSSLKIIEY